MTQSTEQQRQSKEAGAVVYLMEELGDARMRCDQLLRYIEKASKLVEQSSHKDHFFEVAGDVIRGIPESAFKLHKALEAVALAANRIDYEEIKQDLRPEKVEELERVLKDVRVRQVQRRSLPMLNPASVVQQLKGLAKKARSEGRLDTEGLSTLIAALEVRAPKKQADALGTKVAAHLEALAHALENPPAGEEPSRRLLAQHLRRVLAVHLDVTPKAAKEDEKQSRYEEGKSADPTENMSESDAKAWKDNTEEHKDKFKKEAGKPPEAVAGHINTAIDHLKKVSRGSGNPKLLLINAFTSLSDALTKMGQDEAIENLIDRINATIRSKWSQRDWMEAEKADKTAAEDEKQSRFEEGKPADPTEEMSEADAKEWKENTEKHKDKFKAAAEDDKTSRYEEGKSADPTKNMSEGDAKAWKENTEKHKDKFKSAGVYALSWKA